MRIFGRDGEKFFVVWWLIVIDKFFNVSFFSGYFYLSFIGECVGFSDLVLIF